jgi:hypothetical protein
MFTSDGNSRTIRQYLSNGETMPKKIQRLWQNMDLQTMRRNTQIRWKEIQEHHQRMMLAVAALLIILICLGFFVIGRLSLHRPNTPTNAATEQSATSPNSKADSKNGENKIDIEELKKLIINLIDVAQRRNNGPAPQEAAKNSDLQKVIDMLHDAENSNREDHCRLRAVSYDLYIRLAMWYIAKPDMELAAYFLASVPETCRGNWEFNYLSGLCKRSIQPFSAIKQAGQITAVAVNRDGSIAIGEDTPLTNGRAGSTLRLLDQKLVETKSRPTWSIADDGSLARESTRFLEDSKIVSLKFVNSDHETTIVCARLSKTLLIVSAWSLESGKPVGKTREISLGKPDINRSQIAFHPTKHEFCLIGVKADEKNPHVLRFVSGQNEPILLPNTDGANAITYNQTGSKLLVVRDRDSIVFDEESDFKTSHQIDFGGLHCAMDPSGSLLVLANGTKIRVLSCPEGRLEVDLNTPREATAVCFLDPTRVLVGTKTGEIEVNDLALQRTLLVLRAGGGPVTQIIFDKKHERIVSIHSDNSIRVFETPR